jgi:site-specific DNA-methyltransferase (adenine-specific)
VKRYSIVNADLLDWLRGRTGPKAHAVLCDPPYFLGSIVKRFGGQNSAPAKFGRDGAFQRQSRGFMGQSWDGFESPQHFQAWCTTWGELLLDHVHPGAVLMAFGGTRTAHRLTAGLEDAGWIIADQIVYMYGSGFPKSHNISKAIDREAGAERDELYRVNRTGKKIGTYGAFEGNNAITAPATPAAQQWDGYGTALKPAYEPVIVARAPWRGTYAGNAQEYGTGALAIDGGRVGSEQLEYNSRGATSLVNAKFEAGIRPYSSGLPTREEPRRATVGRWPANVILDDHAAARVDAQSGDRRSSGHTNRSDSKTSIGGVQFASGRGYAIPEENTYSDSGGASRFFYTSKAQAWEREAGLHHRTRRNVNDGRATSIDNAYQRGDTQRLNVHPTVKPVDLTRYLATLLLPPELDALRTLLVPFSGSGSEMIGALLAGWERVIGVEQSREYAQIARDRLRWWVRFNSIEQAKAAYDADRGEAVQRQREHAAGVEQLALFAPREEVDA